MIETGSAKFFGGVIAYETVSGMTEREWLAGREHDGDPVHPGESREVVLVTQPSFADRIVASLAKDGGDIPPTKKPKK